MTPTACLEHLQECACAIFYKAGLKIRKCGTHNRWGSFQSLFEITVNSGSGMGAAGQKLGHHRNCAGFRLK